jgi:hypothetical protein
MPELDRGARAGRKPGQKGVEQDKVLAERGRQLEEQDARLVVQRARQRAEGRNGRRHVAKPRVVRDPARSLEREPERVGRLRGPPGKHPLGRQAVKGVVDLDRPEAGGVKGEHPLRGQVIRVEATPPLEVVVP